jgi:hypothetical protein
VKFWPPWPKHREGNSKRANAKSERRTLRRESSKRLIGGMSFFLVGWFFGQQKTRSRAGWLRKANCRYMFTSESRVLGCCVGGVIELLKKRRLDCGVQCGGA